MSTLAIRGVSKAYGHTQVLNNISLSIASGEFVSLLGPSGCGKSTLLRMIAGLESQDEGTISIGERDLVDLRPKQRDVAMVFQSYALYPHMTVADNMAVPLRMRRLSGWQRLPVVGRWLPGTTSSERAIRAQVQSTATALGLQELLHRKPGQLSGGQRQRVAVGRAMVRQPAVFLMDEPLSNLDAKLRVQLRTEIKELHQKLGATFVYVTHDQSEAMTLSDRVAVMLGGQLIQTGTPQEIYSNPMDSRVAEFVGAPKMNLFPVTETGQGMVRVGEFAIETPHLHFSNAVATIGVRPENLHLVERAGASTLSGVIRLVEHMGSDLYVHVQVAALQAPVVARLPVDRSAAAVIGQVVNFHLRRDHVLLFDADGRRLQASAKLRSLREYA